MNQPRCLLLWITAAILSQGINLPVFAQPAVLGIYPEQRRILVRDPASLPAARIPGGITPPPTVRVDQPTAEQPIYLDDLIQQALANTDVVRVLSSVGAASSGQTIYDPAIATTRIDQQQATFDPTVATRHDFFRDESPVVLPDPLDPTNAFIIGTHNNSYTTTTGITKRTLTGGDASVSIDVNRDDRGPVPPRLNPQSNSALRLQLSQPLLRGAGYDVNRVPIVLARIDAESSFFRLKGSVQETVRGVIQAYWNLAAARVTVWAIEQQVEQAQFAVDLETARQKIGLSTGGQLAQARLAVASFRANLVTARSSLLNREASLRGILGLPPNSPERMLPMTLPVSTAIDFDWEELLVLAERSRPDLVELKLILEADYQVLLQSRNNALPDLDAVMLYRWNGVEGELPLGNDLRSRAGDFTGWALGVNFSVPLGLRQSRAQLREQELIIARDRAIIDQRMLEIVHDLASSLRDIDQQYAQLEAFRETRIAAAENLRQQLAGLRSGKREFQFINVLQAITDWGSAVSNEASAVAQYNTALANLEQNTGTILESHGVRFFEERYASIGPIGLINHARAYPRDMRPTTNQVRTDNRSEIPIDEYFRRNAPDLNIRRAPPVPDLDSAPQDEERLPPPVPTPRPSTGM